MDCLDSLDMGQIIIITDVVAVLLSACRTADELNVLGNIILTIGSFLVTFAALQEAQEANGGSEQCIKEMQKQIKELQKQINKLEKKTCN